MTSCGSRRPTAAPCRPRSRVSTSRCRLVLDSGQTVVRNYSLSGPPGGPEYRISVKREPHGLASDHIHASVRVGQTIEAAAPRGTFTLAPGRPGGAGVGRRRHHAGSRHAPRPRRRRLDAPVFWIHGARNRIDDAFADEVHRLLTTLPGARWSTCYSSPSPADRLDEGGVTVGRITAAVVERLGIPVDADLYLCGPAAFMADLTAALVTLGFAPTQVRTETFGTLGAITPASSAAAMVPRGSRTARRNRTGGDVRPQRADGAVARSIRLGAGVGGGMSNPGPMGLSHRRVPHVRDELVSGGVTYEPEPVDRPALGNVLVCCVQPCDELVVDL